MLGGRFTAQRLPGQVVPAELHRLSRLLVEVVHRVLELVLLKLELLASRSDLDQSATDLRDLLEHLFVAEVKHLAGVLRFVQRSVRFGFDDVVSTFEEAHSVSINEVDSSVARPARW